MKTKTKDLELPFPVSHDFEKDLNFFKLSDQEIFDMTIKECRTSEDSCMRDMILVEVFYGVGRLGIEGQYMSSKIRHNVPELVSLLYSLGLMDDGKEGNNGEEWKPLQKSLSEDILLITKIDAVVHTLNSCHFFVSSIMSFAAKIVGCKKIAFSLAKNIFVAHVLLGNELIERESVQDILGCLTPLLQELFEVVRRKDPYGRNTECVGQLVEVFEAMSKFIGIDAESDASEKDQSKTLETASVSSEV